jgi:hypothetical protein
MIPSRNFPNFTEASDNLLDESLSRDFRVLGSWIPIESLTFAIDSVSAFASTGPSDLAGVIDSLSLMRSFGSVGLIVVGNWFNVVDLQA